MPLTPLLKVSVILCTYNGGKYIEEQINTILNQTYPLHEVIVVDDCSTDNTLLKLEELIKINPIISLHKNEVNLGYNKNYEKALKLASGDVIAISDQDDVWNLKKIETLIAHWKNNSLLIYCESVIFKNKIPKNPKPHRIIRRIKGTDARNLSLYNTISGHAMLIRKELVALSLPFETDVYYDWWMAVVASCNNGICYEPTVLVYQRAHENNVTLKSSGTRMLDYKRMLLPHLKKFQTTPKLPAQYKFFFQKFFQLLSDSLDRKNEWTLFLFLLKNRKSIFYYKKRPFEIISHLKNAYTFSFKKD